MTTFYFLSRKVAVVLALILVSALSIHSSAYAQMPRTIGYQGFIASPNGAPIADGIHVLRISLYTEPTGGSPVFSESLSTHVKAGLFNVAIGSSNPIPTSVTFDRPYFLGVAVDGEAEMTPRTTFTGMPYALHADVADYANGLSADAKGIVTSVNEVSGSIHLAGDSTLSITPIGNTIQFHSLYKIVPTGIQSISDTENTLIISQPKGPHTKIGIADGAITASKIADQAVTPSKINQAGAGVGQVLRWNGFVWFPSDESRFTPQAGSGMTISGNTFSVSTPLPVGTLNNSTLRWTGNNWAENTNFLSTAEGLTSINNNLFLASSGSGQASELRFFEPLTSGTHYSAFKAQAQASNITYTLPAALPASRAFLTIDYRGLMDWSTSFPMQVPFDQIISGANQGQILTVGNASVLAPSGTGIIAANQFVGPGSTTAAVDLATSEVAGILPIQNGGTNSGAALLGNRLMISKDGAIVELGQGASGQALFTIGGQPTWGNLNLLPTGSINNSTLRWNAATGSWQEDVNVLETSDGKLTVGNGIDLHTANSPLLLNGSAGTTGQFLTSAGVGNTPTWTTGNLLPNGSATDNTLRWDGTSWVENTNVKSSSAGFVTANAGANLNGTSSPLQLNGSAGTTGQFLTSAGSGTTPTWTSGSLLPNGTATDNTLRWNGTSWVESANVKSSSAGLITANAGANLNGTASPLQLNGSAGTAGQFLTSAGTGNTPTWTTGSLLPNGSATDNTLRWNGTSWIESANVKSSSAGLITANAGANLNGTASPLQLNGSAGTAGQFLTSAGTGNTPTWTTGSLLPNGSATDNTLRWNGTSWVESANVKSSSAGLVTANAGANLNGATSPLQLNGSAGTTGQIITSTGANSTPAWTTLAAGNNITLTSGAGTLTIASTGGLTNGTATDNTLRWDGSSWVESANIKSSAAGLITANAGANLNGTTSPLQLNGSAGTTGQFLTSAGAGSTPMWTTGNLLPTGSSTDNTLRWNGTSWVENSNVKSSDAGLITANAGANLSGTASPLQLNGVAGNVGQFLTSTGAGSTPTWTSGSLMPSGSSTDNTLRWNGTSWVESANVKSSAAGLVTANAGVSLSGTTSPLQLNGSSGTAGQVLTSAGAGATPTWQTANILTNGTANDNTLRWNGASWVESANIKSSAAGLLTTNAGLNLNGAASPMLLSGSAGTSGQLLMSSGPGATPTWTNAAVLPTGTSTDNTLRWSGTAWVENANIKSSAAGLLTTNAGITISNNTSPLKVRGSDGTTNYVLASQGAGNTPQWTDPNTLVTNAWKLGGNSGTSPGMGANQNYIGTSDAKDLYFGTNGLEHIRISSTAASTATSPLGVIHTKSVLPGGGSGLITGMTVETLFPSTATNPVVAVGGLFSYSTVNNSFALGVFCAANSTVYVTGTASTSTVRALDGIYIAQNSTNGITHSSAIGAYGSIQTASSSNNTTITNGAAFRSDFQLYSSNSTITNAHGLYVENPLLGFGIQNSSITNFNGVYIENLTVGTTKRAFFYDGSSGNAPVAITSLGQLGIGRSDPTQSLEIRNGNILLSNNNNTAGELRLAEPSSSGSYYSSFKSGAQTANINYTLPTALPAANNGLLISSTAGVLNWGSNLAWDNTNARLGANTTSPNTTADINGDLAMRENGFTASNANNNDISIGNFSFVRMTGPNAAFTITGIAGGNNGKMVILYNSTNQNMTISHNDNNSVASNRIYCKGGANVTVGQYGVATLIYNSSDSRWIVVSTN